MKSLLTLFALFASVFLSAQTSLPYLLDFESSTFPSTNCELYPAGSPSWVLETGISAYGAGNGCISFDNFTNASGSFSLRLPNMNFSHTALPYIRFDVAYAMQPTSVNSDVFGIWWSNNGTSNWQNLQGYSGNSLVTAAPVANIYVPQSTDWRTTTFPLSFLAGRPYVRIAIQDDSYNSNKIYIDNILVFDSATSGMEESVLQEQLNIFPNPFNDKFTIDVNQGMEEHLAIFNSVGEKVYEADLTAGKNTIDLSEMNDKVFFYSSTGKFTVHSGKLIRK